MKYLYIACRVLLAIVFIMSGVDKIHQVFPHPPSVPGDPQTILFTLLFTSGWIKVIGLAELIGGLAILYGGTVPFALCLLAPVTVNILAVSYLIAGGGKAAIAGLVVTVLELVLFYAYRGSFTGIWTTKATPTA
jgi:putative oxidoreductase